MTGSMFKPHEHVSSMPSLQLGAPLHHESHDNTPSYPQHKFSPHFAAAVSAAVSASHKSAFVPTSHQLSLYRYFQLVNIFVTTLLHPYIIPLSLELYERLTKSNILILKSWHAIWVVLCSQE